MVFICYQFTVHLSWRNPTRLYCCVNKASIYSFEDVNKKL